MKTIFKGQKGFTLIELLVVVAIIGVLAAIVVLNIGDFLGRGTVEAANTEVHQVQTAIIAWIVDEGDFSGDVGPSTVSGPEKYLLNQATLQATYVVADNKITSAKDYSSGKWKDLFFVSGTWTDVEPEE